MVSCGYGSNIELFQYGRPTRPRRRTGRRTADIGGHTSRSMSTTSTKAAADLSPREVQNPLQGPIPIKTDGPAAGPISIRYLFATWA